VVLQPVACGRRPSALLPPASPQVTIPEAAQADAPAANSGQPQALAAPGTRNAASLGMGLNELADWSTQYPFLDLMKWSRPWQDWARDKPLRAELDDADWVKRLPSGATAGTVFLTAPEDRDPPYKRFVVRWKGNGVLTYQWAARKVGAAPVGGDLIEVGRGSSLLQIDLTDAKDPIRNITIVPEQFVARFDRGEIFNPDWLSKVSAFRALRYMGWMRTNGSEQRTWSKRPRPQDRSWAAGGGVPLEVLVQLANAANADPWFNVPHQADEEYIRKMAELVHAELAPHLVAYVEHSNEVWNWSFPQSHHALAEAKKRWGKEGDAYMQWHGMRTAQICDTWHQVFGQPGRVQCVLGTQAGWRGLESAALECPLWVAEAKGRAPCYQHNVDALAITGYFSGCLHGKAGDKDTTALVRPWFKEADGGRAKGLEQARSSRHFPCEDSVQGNADLYAYYRNVARQKGLGLVAYEGGTHITGNGHPIQDDPAFVEFHVRVNRALGMKQLYLENLEAWKAAGGGLFVHFVDVAAPSKWGSWGALESVDQLTSPRWEALLEFNRKPCWWEGC
jgi:hypothetical protein